MAKYNYEIDTRKNPFVNPYNFVSIDFEIKSEGEVSADTGKLITGWIDYRLIAKTPLCIPDTESVREKDQHKSYRFMRDENERPIIPGSSVRGVIRNVYETATDSCFSTVRGGEGSKKQFVTVRRSASKDIKPGLIIKDADGKWELYDADFYMLKSKDYRQNKNKNNEAPNREIWDSNICPAYIVKTDKTGKYVTSNNEKKYSGDEVYFVPLKNRDTGAIIKFEKKTYNRYKKKTDVSYCGMVAQKIVSDASVKGAVKGVMVIGEEVDSEKLKMRSNKHHERIFTKKNRVASVDSRTVKNALEGLDATIDVYNDDSVNRTYGTAPGYHGGYKTYERMKKKGVIPVYYSNIHGNLYFQIAAVGRIAYQSDMYKLVGDKKPCQNRKELCKACALFGMVGKESLGSRLRFSDLNCHTDEPVLYSRTLAELGGPKVSYMPFYSDMRMDDDPNKIGFDDVNIEIRGRKFYWHHKPTKEDLDAKKTNRNNTMELIDTGTVFRGKVFFDGVTEPELEELVWALNFWHNDANDRYCHKIGHGKPLGLGSCKLVIDGISRRQLGGNGYTIAPLTIDYAKAAPVEDTYTVKELLAICDFKAMEGKEVKYPYILSDEPDRDNRDDNNDLARHKWFTENKQKRNRDKMMLLPFIDEDQELYPITAKSTDNNRGSYNKGGSNRGNYNKGGNNKGKRKY